MSFVLVISIVLLVTGGWLFLAGFRASRASRIFLERPTTPIGKLAPGSVEIAGTIHADGEPTRNATGLACVIVHTLVEQKIGKNKYREVSRDAVAVPVRLVDETGSCAVTLGHTDLMSEMWERIESRSNDTRTTQILVRDGARVFIAGVAREVPNAQPSDYRGGDATRLVVGAGDDMPLLLAAGGEAGAVWRHGWRPLVAMLAATLMVLVGAVGVTLHVLLFV